MEQCKSTAQAQQTEQLWVHPTEEKRKYYATLPRTTQHVLMKYNIQTVIMSRDVCSVTLFATKHCIRNCINLSFKTSVTVTQNHNLCLY